MSQKSENIELLKIVLIAGGSLYVLNKVGGGFSSIFEAIGISDSKEDKNVNREIENINSPFSYSTFFARIPQGTTYKILTEAEYSRLKKLLLDSFGYFSDNFGQAFNVFKSMPTKSSVAYFAKRFSKDTGSDLLTWLLGGTWPNDRLSSSEVNQIINYVNKLPLYK